MSRLRPCPSCARHVRIVDSECPFCEAELEVTSDATTRGDGQPTNRVAYVLLGAAATAATVAACVGGPDPGPSSSSSGGSSSGLTSSSGETSGALPPYGVPPIDAGED